MDTKQKSDVLTGAAKAKDIQASREPGLLKEPLKGEEKPATGKPEALTGATKGKDIQASSCLLYTSPSPRD